MELNRSGIRWQEVSMSEECREQRPLLSESADDDDCLQWDAQQQRRRRPPSERTRYKLKGAATVFQQWPSYWAPSVYLWFSMATLCLLFFIIYSNALALTYSPSLKLSATKAIQTTSQYENSSTDERILPQVYMHVFTENTDNIDLKTYEPHINILTEEYEAFDFNLFILLNDSISSMYKENSEEENNEQALNALLTDNYKNIKRNTDVKNIKIKYELLSNYLDNSPLGKQWRTFPKPFIPFLVRAVSIWDKGGIAFNPQILIPQQSTAVFVDKLHIIMKEYKKFNASQSEKGVQNTSRNKVIARKNKVNNIRDIIEALEQNELSYKSNEINLTGVETEQWPFITRKLMSANMKNAEENNHGSYNAISKHKKSNSFNTKKSNNSYTTVLGENILATNSGKNTTTIKSLPYYMDRNLLSSIFNKIFREKIDAPNKRPSQDSHKENRSRKSAIPNIAPARTSNVKVLHRPSATSPESKYTRKYYPPKGMNFEQDKLTIDLKGNIIATETPCHAFIGTLFSNTFHHYEDESVTDFIVAELSYFCKGALSACKGINLILV
ncbi:hypothetical protein EVAR_94037_1 [Eumeta japonica]|uniref:Uncharacterized protein n=1 Tax=Eumeta variegata TaxID=151549 RepID=A0A4C1V6J5_EUMVA|nr:hypothetical protein EVAR_94037_1 [Eumeta japonica]